MRMQEIARILHQYPPDCHPSRVQPLGSAGGMSGAQFWRITTPRGELALRRWPPEHPSPERLRFIHTVLAHAAQNGVMFLPVPIAGRNNQTFVEESGHFWELMPWLPGTADYERNPSVDKLRAALRALAKFHIAAATFGVGGQAETRPGSSATAINRHLSRLHDLSHGGVHKLAHAITDATWPDLAPLARQFVAEQPRVVPYAIAQLEPLAAVTLPLQPCIRDIWHEHVLFTGNEVTGIIDFGAIDIDTPATDIARLLGSLVPVSPPRSGEGPGEGESAGWQIGFAAYSAVRPLSAIEHEAIKALDTSGPILAGCNWIRWIYVEGRIFKNRGQVIDRFRGALARVLQQRA